MKKTLLVVAALSAALTVCAQKPQSAASSAPMAAKAVAPHLPKTTTEANLKQWVHSYPAEAAKYKDALLEALQKSNPSAANAREYDAAKKEYAVVNRLVAAEQPQQPAKSTPAKLR